MNAYELADKLENYYDSDYDEIVNMLRQQADLLKKYEKRNVELQEKITKLLAQTKPLNAIVLEALEGVAFKYREPFNEDGHAKVPFSTLAKCVDAINAIQNSPQTKPTHDFNTLTLDTGEKRSLKPLSDEEIIQVRQTTKANNTDNWADSLAFARAIEERHGIK